VTQNYFNPLDQIVRSEDEWENSPVEGEPTEQRNVCIQSQPEFAELHVARGTRELNHASDTPDSTNVGLNDYGGNSDTNSEMLDWTPISDVEDQACATSSTQVKTAAGAVQHTNKKNFKPRTWMPREPTTQARHSESITKAYKNRILSRSSSGSSAELFSDPGQAPPRTERKAYATGNVAHRGHKSTHNSLIDQIQAEQGAVDAQREAILELKEVLKETGVEPN
jgi:hypothetical protein